MSTEPIIRPAEAADAATIADLLGQLGYPAEEGAVARRLARLGDSATDRVLVAEDASAVVGVATLHVIPLFHRDDGDLGRLSVIVVDEARRGGGVGRILVAAVEKAARELGCARIEVTTGLRRVETHRFYEELGYEERPRRYLKEL
jgi:N-acetylglutamate synthase-like GNAT family acetyltransferase